MSSKKSLQTEKRLEPEKAVGIGGVVKLFRELKGLSQNGLAKLLRTTPTAIVLWEADKRRPNKWVCGEMAMMVNREKRPKMSNFFYQLAEMTGKIPGIFPDDEWTVPAELIDPGEVLAEELDRVSAPESDANLPLDNTETRSKIRSTPTVEVPKKEKEALHPAPLRTDARITTRTKRFKGEGT